MMRARLGENNENFIRILTDDPNRWAGGDVIRVPQRLPKSDMTKEQIFAYRHALENIMVNKYREEHPEAKSVIIDIMSTTDKSGPVVAPNILTFEEKQALRLIIPPKELALEEIEKLIKESKLPIEEIFELVMKVKNKELMPDEVFELLKAKSTPQTKRPVASTTQGQGFFDKTSTQKPEIPTIPFPTSVSQPTTPPVLPPSQKLCCTLL